MTHARLTFVSLAAIALLIASGSSWMLAAGPKGAFPRKLLPVDVASADPGLAKVRAQMLEAARQRNFDLLLPVLAPELRVDFEPHSPSDFLSLARTWPEDQVATFWRDMRDAVQLGMARRDDYVYAPYVVVGLQGSEGELLAITGNDVPVRAAPRREAPSIERLAYDVVEIASEPSWSEDQPARIDGDLYGWHRIITPSGKTGWVSEKYARSSIDRRFLFQRIHGEWKLVAIAAGD
jgi:hypothetical protein